MKTQENQKEIALVLGLLFLMAVTRGHPLEGIVSIPDATLAVFFIGGVYLRRYVLTPIFFLAATLIDNLAFLRGISDWCFTPAYFFLIPAYLTLWFAGRKFSSLTVHSVNSGLALGGGALLSTTIAFTLTSGSFSLLSGYYDQLTLMEHVSRSTPFYATYLLNTMVYFATFILAINCKSLFTTVENRG
ncbi:MAG: hypothetical protein COV67_00885 [Nitrospinae bacterium CG11_big_fil_rev_8_21_14_0_20_56_8]|nr:MAG: hypothetical protein COV67_00885 [Nitrospinae bacterium CG11_big_fil_rev_8_21_14_0_20_56_8]